MCIPSAFAESRCDVLYDFLDAHPLAVLVGVELRITRIEGKWKASQKRSDEDVAGVISGLSASAEREPQNAAMAAVVRDRAVRSESRGPGAGR